MWDSNKINPTPKRVSFGAANFIPQQNINQPSSSYAFDDIGQENVSLSSNYSNSPPLINNYYTPLPIPLNNYQPMADVAMTYGTVLADQGKHMMEQKFERWVSLSRLKYYFAVDTKYVGKKLTILMCPYLHKDWALQYDQENQPIAPRFDLNAPDLYIPLMAFVTFILTSGWIMGMQKKFTPEQLGIRASTCLIWQIIEVLLTTLLLYIMNIGSLLRILDIFAFSAYKYVGMIVCVIIATFFGNKSYYITLAYFGISIGYFLIKTWRLIILPNAYNTTFTNQNQYPNPNDPYYYDPRIKANKRQKAISYLLLSLCFLVQPVMMFILTYHLIPNSSVLPNRTLNNLANKFL
ncbi:unnamed protein product [Gordionus sp. m RMFG-2023]